MSKTVGTQYLEAQSNDVTGLTLKEINDDMVKSLIEDLNQIIESNPFEGRSFYVNVVEHRDLQMPNAIKRRIFTQLYRPYPEDNTLVFYVNMDDESVFYCWDLPHHSELPNILINAHLYDHEYITRIKDWMRDDLSSFGFIKVSMESAQVEGYDEKKINAYREAYYQFIKEKFNDPKSVEAERRLGHFWIPNKFHKDKLLEDEKPKVFIS